MSKTTISVVIPCYNAELTIEKCIYSIHVQTYQPEEIIVVDDGSSDHSLLVLERLKEEIDIPLIIIAQTNGGPSKARNNGVKIAKGEWIAFLDSDDYWLEDKLEKQIHGISLIPKLALLGYAEHQKENILEINLQQLLFKNYFQTSSVLVKKEVILANLFDENQRYSEDYKCWLLIATNYTCAVLKGRFTFPVNNKSFFGEVGLSANLKKMQEGELGNFQYLYRAGSISLIQYLGSYIISTLKYFRRVLIVKLRKK